ncbi:unnamed protein product [Clonostachys rosea f. rosea IK726]|uniref:Uncharacterized protein n=1 Tax=Clonostachys rosea f. rosea IK726 TaxID=1349383 RepID=A0ACA9U3P4_BIOOC|nr:unnamed protein product [Clonostachys rosea f. rosea IK726]
MDKKAHPDCRTCRRRRIRCDRQRPSCLKCVSRDLSCPGYGRRIQWVNGVASRGRLKGHPTPNPDHQDDAPESEHVDSAAIASPGDGQVTDQHIQDVETGAVVLFQPRRIPELREDTAVFLDYYDKSIAGLMVWFDSDDNAYRSCALPLARRQPGLFLAIAAVSAFHGSSASPSFPDQARDRCLASDFFLFLRNQLAIHDVLSSITAFHDPSDLLATVTTSPSSTPNPQLRRDFTRIVDIFHSAALLYAHRCLGFIFSADNVAALEHALLSRRLLDQLLRLEDVRAWPQNLLWPAFIAGVECHGDQAAQGVVEGLCRSLYEVTRFGHYLGVLDFLRAFWGGDRDDWRGLAGEWEAEGRRVLLS